MCTAKTIPDHMALFWVGREVALIFIFLFICLARILDSRWRIIHLSETYISFVLFMILPNMHKKVSKNLNRAQHISVMSDISVTVIYRAVSDYTDVRFFSIVFSAILPFCASFLTWVHCLLLTYVWYNKHVHSYVFVTLNVNICCSKNNDL